MSGKGRRPEKAEGSIKLPPSGLAEDILSGLAQEGDTAPVRVEAGPEEIYAFADSLGRDGTDGEERRRAEESLETWVTFTLDRESFGLPVTHVQEILRVATITRVPHAPRVVRGVTNVRGRVLPVVDLRVRLGLAEAPVGAQSRILVVSSRGRLLGLLVDAVQQVIRLDRSKVQPPPPDVMTAQSDYILGVYHLQESLAILLEVDRVLLLQGAVQNGPQAQDIGRSQ